MWCFDKDDRRKEHQLEDDIEEPTKECEDTELRDYIVLLQKSCSNQGTTWSSWRECRRRRDCDDYLEWPPKIMGFIHSRDMCKKEIDLFQSNLRRMHTRRSSAHNKRREDGSNWRSNSHDSKKIHQAMRNMYFNPKGFNSCKTSYPSQHLDKKWCSCEWRRWWSKRLQDIRIKDSTHQTNKHKCSMLWWSYSK